MYVQATYTLNSLPGRIIVRNLLGQTMMADASPVRELAPDDLTPAPDYAVLDIVTTPLQDWEAYGLQLAVHYIALRTGTCRYRVRDDEDTPAEELIRRTIDTGPDRTERYWAPHEPTDLDKHTNTIKLCNDRRTLEVTAWWTEDVWVDEDTWFAADEEEGEVAWGDINYLEDQIEDGRLEWHIMVYRSTVSAEDAANMMEEELEEVAFRGEDCYLDGDSADTEDDAKHLLSYYTNTVEHIDEETCEVTVYTVDEFDKITLDYTGRSIVCTNWEKNC